MSVLQMPLNNKTVKPRYYEAYYESIIRSAKLAEISVMMEHAPEVWTGASINAYMSTLDGQPFIMDFSDLKPFQLDPNKYNCPYFKWHYSYDYPQHSNYNNVYPLCIVQDFDWDKLLVAQQQVKYTASGLIVTNNQRIKAAATVRRTRVQKLLRTKYGSQVSIAFKEQSTWWDSHSNCLVAVHVPGARNDILDRGQWELMGLGVCVISPVIVTVLAGHRTLEPFKHFVPVDSDYANLIEMIEWCKENRNTCVTIGRQAQELFNSIGPPEVFWNYVRKIVHG